MFGILWVIQLIICEVGDWGTHIYYIMSGIEEKTSGLGLVNTWVGNFFKEKVRRKRGSQLGNMEIWGLVIMVLYMYS